VSFNQPKKQAKTALDYLKEGYPPTPEQKKELEQERPPIDPSKANTHQLLSEGFRRLLETDKKAELDD
jgi:hypothetical protein